MVWKENKSSTIRRFSTVPHVCKEAVSFCCTHTQKPKSYKHTHTAWTTRGCHPTHTQKIRDTLCTVMPFCGSVMPDALRASLSVIEDRKQSSVKDNGSSCIRNMDGTLTLLVQLICVSIPLAAVQTSPGFTVHSLLQNYSSSMQPNCREEPLLWTGAASLWQAGWQRLTHLMYSDKQSTTQTQHTVHPLGKRKVHGSSCLAGWDVPLHFLAWEEIWFVRGVNLVGVLWNTKLILIFVPPS